ncbi:putative HTH-type transcriptional regulator [Pseudomonas hunanensis]|uniref:Helix-turn-helix domain-containing protein n=1 Tax=Pseudomonas putida TaxID=303 RepID=A0A7Z9ES25_PSEPU|nr:MULTISPECIES: XRE family transcriptional regulator [Pseudomonas]ELU0815078.1 helix-turn-helix domain-containing protein [Pseudomonas putida]KAF0256841.1 helix-turn-helix domain-containing protein [Pseudomonas putida]MCE0780572.1 XRE family transcriptional regulator [Pseudomonas sp. NMI542_15]MDY7070565.1 putative HTH-type transcriptional regulator [Pseudomonas hunanensis]WQE53461.1 XRE family transcriptional regulator [Pseudomonas putida]
MERYERIAKAIAASGKRKSEIAAACGVSASAVTQWVTGESKSMKPENIYALAKATGFHAKWLAIGEGPEQEGHPEANVRPVAQPNMMYRYPVISWVAAGAWAEAVEPFPPGFSDRYEISDYQAKGPAFWLEVKGDSMTSPIGQTIAEGTLILVDTEADAFHGKLVIAKLGNSNEATFKKLVEDGGRKYLKPLNPAYPTEVCAEDCRIVGVVVRALQKL